MPARPSADVLFARLRDGAPVRIRPLRPGDRRAIAAAIRLMSPQSRFNRFHGAIGGLTDQQLAYLTEIDHDRHMAWVAESAGGRPHRGMGVARCVRNPADPQEAEVAITVLDGYQRRGLASLFLDHVQRVAAARGILRLYGDILAGNLAMVRLMQGRGARVEPAGHGLLRATLTLPAPPPAAGRGPGDRAVGQRRDSR